MDGRRCRPADVWHVAYIGPLAFWAGHSLWLLPLIHQQGRTVS